MHFYNYTSRNHLHEICLSLGNHTYALPHGSHVSIKLKSPVPVKVLRCQAAKGGAPHAFLLGIAVIHVDLWAFVPRYTTGHVPPHAPITEGASSRITTGTTVRNAVNNVCSWRGGGRRQSWGGCGRASRGIITL